MTQKRQHYLHQDRGGRVLIGAAVSLSGARDFEGVVLGLSGPENETSIIGFWSVVEAASEGAFLRYAADTIDNARLLDVLDLDRDGVVVNVTGGAVVSIDAASRRKRALLVLEAVVEAEGMGRDGVMEVVV